METWSNIEIPPDDPEIAKIDDFEKSLGEVSEDIRRVRELITRFEICHFKCQQHLSKIKDSIVNLRPSTIPSKIGINHIQHGENAWKNDRTGRTLMGQQYVWAIKKWLGVDPERKLPEQYDKKMGQQVEKWLGNKSADKERLVRLLLARLTWDWKTYEGLLQKGEHEDLEFRICRMDICHYAFPSHIDMVLQGIGRMKPVEGFEGCGTYSADIKAWTEKEFSALNDWLNSLVHNPSPNREKLTRIWLIACLAKTVKEHVKLTKPLVELE